MIPVKPLKKLTCIVILLLFMLTYAVPSFSSSVNPTLEACQKILADRHFGATALKNSPIVNRMPALKRRWRNTAITLRNHRKQRIQHSTANPDSETQTPAPSPRVIFIRNTYAGDKQDGIYFKPSVICDVVTPGGTSSPPGLKTRAIFTANPRH